MGELFRSLGRNLKSCTLKIHGRSKIIRIRGKSGDIFFRARLCLESIEFAW
jgi:hypothetical protein